MASVSVSPGTPGPSPTASATRPITTQQIWKDHPEKVLAFTEEFAEKNPKTVKAILRAMLESSQHIDKLENRPHMGRSGFPTSIYQHTEGNYLGPNVRGLRLRRRAERRRTRIT